MTTRHTPGPWKCQLAKSGSGRLQVSGPRGEQIAILWRSSKDTTEANARLIAAAPEMFEALSVLYAVAAEQLGDDWAAVTDAAAVIAKATGEQQ
ncbi:hypothetical protein ACXXCT_08635 [Bordetella bronchiseptica]